MRRFRTFLACITAVLLLNGCGVGQAIKNSVQAGHYLQTGQFRQGEKTFREAVRLDPDDPQANYYLGRFLLAQKQPRSALKYLERAARIDPGDQDYQFWLGFAYGAIGQLEREHQQYLRVLKMNPRHLQALIFLGHNRLKRKKFDKALATYQQVLSIWPTSPSALYNRALIARILDRRAEERTGWLTYLDAHPSGALAIRAADHLNALGDFSYRNHRLGGRTITLSKIWFQPFSATLSPRALPSLDLVGATFSNLGQGRLQILVFLENDRELAKKRAITIKKYLLKRFPRLSDRSIGISWFDQPEVFRVEGKTVRNPESVRFFLSDLTPVNLRPRKTKKRIGRGVTFFPAKRRTG